MQSSRLSISSNKPSEIEQYVRLKVNHSYNKDVFNQQLEEQMVKNLAKMEEHLIKDLKRKLLLEKMEKEQEERRIAIQRKIDQKLNRSKINRDHHFDNRSTDLRSSVGRSEDEQGNLNNSYVKYNKVKHAGSLIREPYYQTNKKLGSHDMQLLKKIVEEKKNRSQKNITRKKLYFVQPNSQNQFFPGIKDHKNEGKQMLKRSQSVSISKKSEPINYEDSERQKIQLKRRQYLLQKLNRPTFDGNKTKSKQLLGPRSMSLSSVRTQGRGSLVLMEESKKPVPNSIIYEQGEDRERHSYRKQIKQQIRQYIARQKQKYLQ